MNQDLRLFIPNPHTEKKAIRLRLDLIQKFEIYSVRKLKEFLNMFPKNQTSVEQVEQLGNFALSNEIIPDEIDEIIIFASDFQIHHKRLDPVEIRQMIPVDCTIFQERNFMRKLELAGRTLLNKYGARIRAQIAFLEIVALIAPEKIVHELIAISPSYLASERINHWITKNQFLAIGGTKAQKETAEKNLRNLTNAIVVDKRKIKVRKYDYWTADNAYHSLVKNIKQTRRCWDHKNKEIREDTRDYFKMICKAYKFDESMNFRFRSKNETSPSELALEIMIGNNVIDDSKAFRDFQTYVKKLKNKHSWSADLEMRLEDYWNYYSKFPEQLFAYDSFKILEEIQF